MHLAIVGLRGEMEGVKTRLSDVETRLGRVETRLDRVETRLDRVETKLDRVMITVAEHSEKFVRIEERLKKLDLLDTIVGMLDRSAAEAEAFRRQRAILDKTFSDHQDALTDHEARIHRLERRSKPS